MPAPTDALKTNTMNSYRGERHHSTNLTEDKVREIRKECEEADELRKKMKRMSLKAIGARHGISAQTAYEIKHGYSWGHVT